ncbi:MAG: CoB--CoM heterodisulfide reductase iron-sulfur subunit A family protein, partial [Deltaproteobacteria bacterium]|nr:CoB--CoM heterodisulfide reductase iron-sulfur subunit A family protein [Deltaproteobacteria bacterium]
GPTMGHLVRPSDRTEPKKIAWLQCVGSRDMNACDHPYCSSVCCMYAVKEATLAMEHAHDSLDVSIFFMDMRTFGKDFEKYYENAKKKGVKFIRSRVHTMDQLPDDSVSIQFATEDGELRREEFDMVVLSHGLEIPRSTVELVRKLDVELGDNHFIKGSSFEPVATSRSGIYACGTLNGPKDIPISVVEASAAACAASGKLSKARGSLVKTKEIPAPLDVTGEPPKVGVFVCSCGINIAGVVDVEAVAEYAGSLPYVVYVQNNLFSCSQDAQDNLSQVIREQGLNRVVVAACTPRTHEPLFQETLQSAGLNKYLFELANIRNQDSWVHVDSPKEATDKAKDQVRMAVAKVTLLEPLKETRLSVNPAALVIGGGIAGMNAALSLAGQGYETHLVERETQLGGTARRLRVTATGEQVGPYLKELISRVEKEPLLKLHTGAKIKSVDGFMGNFKTTLAENDKVEIVEHGVAIIATGADEYKPVEYAYGQHPGVMTHLELDHAIMSGNVDPKTTNSVVFIQCVGSREPERPYCSKVCCTHSVETALHFKKENPDCRVIILYRDMRTYGERELLYREARERGVLFIRYNTDKKPVVEVNGKGLRVRVPDHILKRELTFDADVVGLASAVVSNRPDDLARMFKVAIDSDGWFLEAHQKLRPVDFATDGIYMCGLAHYPKPIEESVAQAQAAVSRAVTVLSRAEMSLSGTVSYVDQRKCVGCGVCWTICPYKAIDQDEKGLAIVNEALCKGCGACVSSCRSGAPNLRGFSNQDVMAQIEATP